MAGEVTILQLQNAALDAETLAEVCMVGYTADTTTNRDGDVINTLQGQLKLLGYIPPIAYAGSIAFLGTENTKTIERSGIVYAPLPSALPFTTSPICPVNSISFFCRVFNSSHNVLNTHPPREPAMPTHQLNIV